MHWRNIWLLVALYLLLWFATYWTAGAALEKQVRAQAGAGWRFDVKEVFSPAPLIFRSRSDYVLTSHEGYGEEGWFLWTPWKVYLLKSRYTWIS